MTPWQSRATKLTQRMADDMKLRNFAQATIDAYTYHVGRFAEFLGKCCKRYVAKCRELFPGQSKANQPANAPGDTDTSPETPSGRRCPNCDGELELIERVHRTSWCDIFSGSGCPRWNTFREGPG